MAEIAANDVVASPTYNQSRTPTEGQASYAFNLNLDNKWYIKNDVTSWVEIDFGEPVYIEQLRVAGGSSNQAAQFNVQISTDGVNYTTIFSYSSSTYRETPTPWKTVNTNVRFIRHNHTNSTGWHDFRYCGVILPPPPPGRSYGFIFG